MSTALSGMVFTRGPVIFNSNVSRYTITRSEPTNMFLVLYWSILSLEQWTRCDRVHLVVFSVQTILCSVKVVLVTTGRKDVSSTSCLLNDENILCFPYFIRVWRVFLCSMFIALLLTPVAIPCTDVLFYRLYRRGWTRGCRPGCCAQGGWRYWLPSRYVFLHFRSMNFFFDTWQVSKSHIHLVVVLVLVWVLSWFLKSARNTPTGWCVHTLLYPVLRYRIPSLR